MNEPGIEIVGCGPGGADQVTPAARAAVARVGLVLGWPRVLALFPEAAPRAREACGVEAVLDQLREAQTTGARVAVLVSGDVGLFSLARKVVATFGREACRLTPGIGALQIACTRFGLSRHDDRVRVIDAHARVPDAAEAEGLAGRPAVAFRDRGEGRVWCAALAQRWASTHEIRLCERLTHPDERIVAADADALARAESPAVAVFLPRAAPLKTERVRPRPTTVWRCGSCGVTCPPTR